MGLKEAWSSFKQELKQASKDGYNEGLVKAVIREDPYIKRIIEELELKDIKELDKWNDTVNEIKQRYNVKMNELLETSDVVYWDNKLFFRAKLLLEYLDRKIQGQEVTRMDKIKLKNELREFKLLDITTIRLMIEVYNENMIKH